MRAELEIGLIFLNYKGQSDRTGEGRPSSRRFAASEGRPPDHHRRDCTLFSL